MGNILSDLADGMKKLQALSKELSELEHREAIVEHRELLLLAREEINSLREEASGQRAEITDLRAQLNLRANSIVVDGFRYDSEGANPVGLPYCPRCEVAEEKPFRLIKRNDYNSRCPQCDTVFSAAKNGRVNVSPPQGAATASINRRKPWIDY